MARTMMQYHASKEITQLNEALDNSETAIDVDSATDLQKGQHITIDSEIMKITSISSNTLTVSRAQKGTTATTHSDDTKVTSKVWQDVVITGETTSALLSLQITDTQLSPRIASITLINNSADPFNSTPANANGPYTGTFTDFMDMRLLDSDTKQILFAGKIYSIKEYFDEGKGTMIELVCKDALAQLADMDSTTAYALEIDISKAVYNIVEKTDTKDDTLRQITGDAVSSRGGLLASIFKLHAPNINFQPGTSGNMDSPGDIETLGIDLGAIYDTNSVAVTAKFANNMVYRFTDGADTILGHIVSIAETDPTAAYVTTTADTFGSDFYVDSEAIDVTNTYNVWNSRFRLIHRGTELLGGISLDIKNNPTKGLSIEFPSNTATTSGQKHLMHEFAFEDDKDTNFNSLDVTYKEIPVNTDLDTMEEKTVNMELISIEDFHFPTLFHASPNEEDTTLLTQIGISNGLGAANTNELTVNETTKGHADYQGYHQYMAGWLQVYDTSGSPTWKTMARIQWLDRVATNAANPISSAAPAYAMISDINSQLDDDPDTGFFKQGTIWRETPLVKGTLVWREYLIGGSIFMTTSHSDGSSATGTGTTFRISHVVQDYFDVGAVLKIDDEEMQIVTFNADANTLQVTRGYNSTSNVSHNNGVKVEVLIPSKDVNLIQLAAGHTVSANDEIAIYNAGSETTEVMVCTNVATNIITVTRGHTHHTHKDLDQDSIGLTNYNSISVNESLNASDTTFDIHNLIVNSKSLYLSGDIISIDDEDMTVTGYSTTTISVTRAARGTLAAAHDNGTKIYTKQQWSGWEEDDIVTTNYATFAVKARPLTDMNMNKKIGSLNTGTVTNPRAIREMAASELQRGNNTSSRIVKFKTYERPEWYVDNSPSVVSADHGGATGLTRITAASSTLLHGWDRGMTWVKLNGALLTTTYGYAGGIVSNSGTTIFETILSTGSVSASDTLRYYMPIRVGDSIYVKNNTANVSANAVVISTVFTEANGIQSTNWTVATQGSAFKRYRRLYSNFATKRDLKRLANYISRHTHPKPMLGGGCKFSIANDGDVGDSDQVDWTAGFLLVGSAAITIAAGTTASTMVSSANGNTSQSGTTLGAGEYLIYWPGTGTALKTIKRANYINVEGNRDILVARCANRSNGAKFIVLIDIDLTSSGATITNVTSSDMVHGATAP